jgi:uncharacterized protein (TIGR03437 family)
MRKILTPLALALLLSTAGQAATTSTTLTVDCTGALDSTFTKFTASGTASFTAGIGNGTFSATASLTDPTAISGSNINVPYTITLSGGTLTGKITLPLLAVVGGGTSANGSATVTGGTGTYAGATGSFTLTGTASGSSTVTLHFSGPGSITTGGTSGGGGGGGATGPTVTEVLDAGSYTKNIAQGSVFVVKGSNLSASGFTSLSFPLPTTSAGVKITFTPANGGAATDAILIYLYNQSGVNQLAAILPSTVATGNYNVTVTSGGATSAAVAVTVVQRKPGIITADGSGTGLAVIQNYVSATQVDIDRFTVGSIGGYTVSPARPGQILVAWLTGLGPFSGAPENAASPGHDFLADNIDIQVLVGTSRIRPLYAGRAPGLSGADQINFQLPADVQTGCTVPFQVSVAGQLSNPSFIAIAPNASANACVEPGYTTAQLQSFDQGGSLTVGNFTLSQTAFSDPSFGSFKTNSINGGFLKITGAQLTSGARYTATATNGCQVLHIRGTQAQIAAGGTATFLDAGAVTLKGPNGSNLTTAVTVTKDATNSYNLSLGTEGLPGGITIPGSVNATLVAGAYTLTGAGGADVGSFNSTVNLGAPLVITGGLPSTVNRSSNLRLNWTGGNSSDLVTIVGYSGTTTGTGANAITDATEFFCTTTAGPGGFTVPSDILSQLPAVSAAAVQNGTGTGFLSVSSSVTPANLNAKLTNGTAVDPGIFSATTGTAALVAYQ